MVPLSWAPKTSQGLDEGSGGEKREAMARVGVPGGQRFTQPWLGGKESLVS